MAQSINKATLEDKQSATAFQQSQFGESNVQQTSEASPFRVPITADPFLDKLHSNAWTYSDYDGSIYQISNQYTNVPRDFKITSPNIYYYNRVYTPIGTSANEPNLLPFPSESNADWQQQKLRLQLGLNVRLVDAEDYVMKYLIKPISEYLQISNIETTTNFDTPKIVALRELIHVAAAKYPSKARYKRYPNTQLPEPQSAYDPEDNTTMRNAIVNGENLNVIDYNGQLETATTGPGASDFDYTGYKMAIVDYLGYTYFISLKPIPTTSNLPIPGVTPIGTSNTTLADLITAAASTSTLAAAIVSAVNTTNNSSAANEDPFLAAVGDNLVQVRIEKKVKGLKVGSELQTQAQANQFWTRESLIETTKTVT